MNRRVLIIAFAGFVLAAVLAVLTLTGPAPRPREAAPVERPAPPPPAAAESTPAPPPAPEPARPAARRAPAKAAPNPAPASAPAAEPATPAADVGTLHIDSDVPGAQVFIDRVFVGATPVTAANVAPGSHRLNVSAPGYDGVAETVDVAAGPRDIVVKLKVVRLDAAIAVVHKHRMGSCRGRLIATARGLRYETSDKDDGFNVPMKDLETLEVDYLAKNLRLKLQKGRRYDFTDPEGNADRLFVFHRDVEKARDRLKKGDPPASQ
ncbi:MAG TPA: PEGA domain-containing protein [Vicinamibacterales bacterium]|nr:PEGA domain-containing protein [Vicinamibacterales bacterium]